MANIHVIPLKCAFLVFILAFSLRCSDAKLNVNNQVYPFNFEQIKLDLFSKSDLQKTNKFSESNSRNQTEHQCLIELNAIQRGLRNFEPWAIECKLKIFIGVV